LIARRPALAAAFTRRDAVRLAIAASVLSAVLAAILSIDILPSGFAAQVGDRAPNDLTAPRTLLYTSAIQTEQRREAERQRIGPQYDFTPARGEASAQQQATRLEEAIKPIESAFGAVLSLDDRRAALRAAIPTLSEEAKGTLSGMDGVAWSVLHGELIRVLEQAQRQEVRDSQLPAARAALDDRVAQRFPAAQRALAGEILAPLLVANSTYDEAATVDARAAAAAAVQPVEVDVRKGELIVRRGEALTDLHLEKMAALGLLDPKPDLAKFAGWLLLAALLVGVLLAWVWRFRRELWHRNNALLLVGLLLVAATAAIAVTGGRSILPFFVPTAAVALLLAVLLDGSAAVIVTVVLAVIAAAVNGSVELGAYTMLGGIIGVVAVRAATASPTSSRPRSRCRSPTSPWSPSTRCSASVIRSACSSCTARHSLPRRARRSPPSARSRRSATCSGSPRRSSCSSSRRRPSRCSDDCCWRPRARTTTR
jgi:membrane-associated HD superfamily phosphohydrolase